MRYIIICYQGKDSKNRNYKKYALGWGIDGASAKRKAIEVLKMKDWGWYDKKGYNIIESGTF